MKIRQTTSVRVARESNISQQITTEINKAKQRKNTDIKLCNLSIADDSLELIKIPASTTGLDLDSNRLTKIAKCCLKLRHLTHLYLGHNLINYIDPRIKNISSLETLNLSGNMLTTLPKEIGSLKNLFWLNLTSNSLLEIPETIGNLKKLKSLFIFRNPDLSDLPRSLGKIPGITALDRSQTKIPEEVVINILTECKQSQLTHSDSIKEFNSDSSSIPEQESSDDEMKTDEANHSKNDSEIEDNIIIALDRMYPTTSSENKSESDNDSSETTPAKASNTANSLLDQFQTKRLEEVVINILTQCKQSQITHSGSIKESNSDSSSISKQESSDDKMKTDEANHSETTPAKASNTAPLVCKENDFDGHTEFQIELEKLAELEKERIELTDMVDDTQKSDIQKWITRLHLTADYKTRPLDIILQATFLLKTAKENETFRTSFLIQIAVNNEYCPDRASMALNELFVSWQLAIFDPTKGSYEKNLSQLTAIAKTLTLRKLIANAINGKGINESVEVYLYYEINIASRKNTAILTFCQHMLFPKQGNPELFDFKDLEKQINENYEKTLKDLPQYERLAMNHKKKSLSPITLKTVTPGRRKIRTKLR